MAVNHGCSGARAGVLSSFAESSVFGLPNLLWSSSRFLRLRASASEKKSLGLTVSNSIIKSTSEYERPHVIVTGGNSGIGKSTALELARQGMVVTLACRNQKAGSDAAEEIARVTNNKNVRSMTLDLASLDSVRKFAAEYKDTGLPLNVLVNNAGIMACPQSYTQDGFESQFGSASDRAKSRVVVVASAAHYLGDIDFNDLNYRKTRGKHVNHLFKASLTVFQSPETYNNWGAYAQSKLANCLFSLELAERSKRLGLPVISNSMHPGVVDTQLIRYVFPQGLRKEGASESTGLDFLRPLIMKVFGLRTAEEGASTAIFLASSPEATRSGLYYEDSKPFNVGFIKKSVDQQLASRLWDVSVELTGAADALAALSLCKDSPLVRK
ncbi:hypothetical protein MPTK1_4g15420 [Marchantia polymorpha subsp. ruderalis]|uniref:Uncharacterized protein n=2 Tax=Marchantia polymorpha TaxID=3197 RepID=A0A176WNU5_MARPO|nr:hypothetical protein AXG93_1104s1120 [Marchantia polymorpha subsp. ruderalis]PTQ37887.1 hypothetical protein MARPO_0054s0005 [Marchantia polymorpha]BBN08903.1 hypothetical protein Mp_4g15420 [Marchantia polymorpha subsp. ruderalis]|eukprot:PTQ37887.1 hypothetical protein MARPO_0054s0005 [Marchantia polymorpha]